MIIKERKNVHTNEDEYFVKWKTYGHRDNCWVKKSDFDDEKFIKNFTDLNDLEKTKRVQTQRRKNGTL